MTYNSKVLVGNWYEDVKLQEDVMKEFLERRERGDLLIQKMGSLLSVASQPSSLKSAGFKLCFGSIIQLYNPQPANETSRSGIVLAINPSENIVNASVPLSDTTGASGSPSANPSPRNMFVVKSIDGTPDGVPVTYGQNFQLVTLEKLGDPLYLFSDHTGFGNAARKSRHQSVCFSRDNGFRTHWRVEYFNPQERYDRLGEEVKTNEKVIIFHQKTGHALALEEKYKTRNLFGCEFEITTHTYLNDHKAEMHMNHWILRDGAQ